jgi:hypothetical protein
MLYEAVIGIGETYKETVLGKRLYGYPATPLLISYSEGLKKQKNRNRMAWLFGWLFGLFMPGWGKHEHDHHEEERRVRGLYSEIRRIYELMDSSPLSPFYLRERLLAIAHKGVSWQVGIFPILDNAIARDPILWGTRHLRGFKPELIDDQP